MVNREVPLMLNGLFVALVTPFSEDGLLDAEKLEELIEFHISAGADGVVPCATTSESPSLSDEEQAAMIKTAVEAAAGRIKVVAGCGTNSTARSIQNIKRAAALGADAAMAVTPYYNKPTQEGLYAHFMELADRGGLDLMLYNVPGRTGVNLLAGTVARLAGHEHIVAVKEASGKLQQISEIAAECSGRLSVLSGDDALTLPILAAGGAGVVSVVANIVPELMSRLISLYREGDMDGARDLHFRLLPLYGAMFIETNPVPVKEAMNMLGRKVGKARLPLVELTPENRKRLRGALTDFGLLD